MVVAGGVEDILWLSDAGDVCLLFDGYQRCFSFGRSVGLMEKDGEERKCGGYI